MKKIKNRIVAIVKKIVFLLVIIGLMVIASYSTIIIRERRLYDLPNKVSLNNLAKLMNYERTPFVYIRKSGTYLGNIPSLDTPFFLGPVTKVYTAALVLTLYEKGKIDIDEPVSRYFQHPALPFSDTVHIKHLLNHRSGLIDVNREGLFRKIFQEQDHTFTLEEIIVEYTAYDPEEVGKFHYSNSGYYILGKIIEKVTGTTYEKYLYSEIIDRLGLRNTCIYLYDPECQPVRGYVDLGLLELGEGHRRLDNHHSFMSATYAAGSLSSSANDLKTFMKELVKGGLFDFEIMEKEFAEDDGLSKGEKEIGGHYGFGLIDYGKNLYGHTGRTLDASVQVVIEKDSGNVYLYYFGDSGLTR